MTNKQFLHLPDYFSSFSAIISNDQSLQSSA